MEDMNSGQFQSLAQLAVGLNLGFAALLSFFGSSFETEISFMQKMRREQIDVEEKISSSAQSAELQSALNEAKAGLVAVEQLLREVVVTSPISKYVFSIMAFIASIASFFLLVWFSTYSSLPLERWNLIILILTYLPVLGAIFVPVLKQGILRIRVRSKLDAVDLTIAELMSKS